MTQKVTLRVEIPYQSSPSHPFCQGLIKRFKLLFHQCIYFLRRLAGKEFNNDEERAIAIDKRMAALNHMNQAAKLNDANYKTSMASDPDLRKAAEQGTLIGTPEEIIGHLTHLRDGGVEYLLLAGAQMSPPQMRAFAEEIMPAFT